MGARRFSFGVMAVIGVVAMLAVAGAHPRRARSG